MTSKAAIKRGEANKTASPSKSARDPLLSSLALLLKHPVAKMLLIAVLCVLLLVASPVQSLSDETTAMRYMVKAGTAPEMAMMMAPPQMEEFEDNGMDARSYEMLDGSGIGKVVSDEMKDAMQGLEGKTYPTARMLVREGHLSLETPVGSLAERIQQIEAIMAEDSEAYVESQSQFDDWDHGHRGSGSKRVQGYRLTLRIPSDSYDTSVQFLRDLVGEGSVVNWSTDAYVDASSRADVLQASRQALQTLLQEAKQVKEVLEIQRELNRLVEAYESQKNRAQRLQKQSVCGAAGVYVVGWPLDELALSPCSCSFCSLSAR